ncbi:MAG TPA: hypothetical protein VFO76_02345, partial [Candidatus Kapabacteria bacterium]|nr:hypothetical protein [Candidatus Kapabacteria bacterium]
FNSRYAETFAELSNEVKRSKGLVLTDREAMIIGMAKVSKLTILTKQYYDRYAQINVATVISSIGAGS